MDKTAPGRNRLALVVDDDATLRILAASALAEEGFRVEEAGSGEDGVAAFGRLRPDLVLLDVLMPGMDGFAACRAIRALPGGDRVPVVMMTGLEDYDSVHRAYEAGATDFVAKPVNWLILRYRIRYILRASRAFNDLFASEANNRALLSAIPDAVFRLGSDGRLLRAVGPGDGGAVPFPVDLDGKTLEGAFAPEVAAQVRHTLREILEGGGVRTFDFSVPAGVRTRWYEGRMASLGSGEALFIARDVTLRKEAEERLMYLAYYDPLTGLPNRVQFHERLDADISRARRHKEMVGVVLLDLDRFKEVNDTLGHAAGDELLRLVGKRLQARIRKSDFAARMSGDEFCVVLTDQPGESGVFTAARRLLEIFENPFPVGGQEVAMSASAGISVFPVTGGTGELLLKQADIAMYQAKAQGRGGLRLFSEEMSAEIEERVRMERGLRKAVRERELVLHYQPIVELSTGLLCGAEALVRWNRPGHGLVAPMSFIPLAEETGSIYPISERVFEEACARAGAWRALAPPPFRVSVNTSARLFQQYDLAGVLLGILERHGVPPLTLEVEVTETAAMQNMEAALDALWKLHGRGIRISLDDFGTGYSSMAYLKKFPIQVLKVDRHFVADMTTNAEDRAIVEAIVAMARALGVDVVAEGIETPEQFALLRACGCPHGQGFLFGKPMPAEDFEALLKEGRVTVP